MDNSGEQEWYLVEVKSKKHVPISKKDFTIGRSIESNLCFDVVQASRNHAVIHVEADGKLFLEDLSSSNGTYLNKVRIAPHLLVPVSEGDIIVFGDPCAINLLEYKVSKTMDDFIELDSDEDELTTVKTEPSVEVKTEIKMEPEELSRETKNRTPCLGFSAAIECIEISDDEDNQEAEDSRLTNLFSQIQVKREPTELQMDPNFLDIKLELDYMDYQEDNILNAVPIDLDDDYEDYNLLDVLGDGFGEEGEGHKSNEDNEKSHNVKDQVNDFVFDLSKFENQAQNIENYYNQIESVYENLESQYLNGERVDVKSKDLLKSSNHDGGANIEDLRNEIQKFNETSKYENNEIFDKKNGRKNNTDLDERFKKDENSDDKSDGDERADVSEASEVEASFSEENESSSASYSDIEEETKELKKESDLKSSAGTNNKNISSASTKNSSLLKEILPKSSKTPKYVKPPIIEPHTEPFLKRRRGYVDPTLDEKAKEVKSTLTKVLKRTKNGLNQEENAPKKRRGRKRKTEVQCEVAKKKTKSETNADIKKEMSRRNMSTEISSNTKIIEKHQKVKEKMKIKKENENPIADEKVKKAAAKVKVSENRGIFLIKDQPGPSSAVARRKSVDVPSDLHKCFDELLIRQRQAQALRSASQVSLQQHHDHDEIVSKIIKWSVKWFVEQAQLTKSPPVNDNYLHKLTNSFDSFDTYKSVMNGLTMLEMWTDIYKSFEREYGSKELLKAVITSDKVCGSGLYLTCECYISEKQIKTNNMPKLHDFIVCAVPYQSTNLKMQLGVGIVTKLSRIYLDDNSILSEKLLNVRNDIDAPKYRIYFSVVTRYNPDKPLRPDYIAMRIIDNVEKHFHLFRTIKLLYYSNLKKMVLKPCLIDYQISPLPIELREQAQFLNAQQKKIVLEAASVCLSPNPGIYLIKGPPGTGKSTVIVHTIFETLINKPDSGYRNASKILVVAPSNAAIDSLIVKINKFRSGLPDFLRKLIKLIRVGPEQHIGRGAQQSRLSYLALNHLLVRYRLQIVDIEAKDDMEKLQIFLGKNRFLREFKETEMELLYGCTIVCSTLGSCCHTKIYELVRRKFIKFSCCIIDEATQCTEVETLCPIQLNIEKFVLVGDPKQLPATVQNMEARDLGFDQSLFSRIFENIGCQQETPVRMLNTQYRMHPEICSFPNRLFYQNRLKSCPKYKNKIKPDIQPYLLFNIIKPFDDKESGHYVNKSEIFIIQKMLELFHSKISSNPYSVGIITPYNHQKDVIYRALNKQPYKEMDITVNTVDGFQGQERDIIIISCVRKDPNNFIENDNRLNVALTRAKQALFIIGNYTLFKQTKTLFEIREDGKKRRKCIDISDTSEKAVTKILQQHIFVKEKET